MRRQIVVSGHCQTPGMTIALHACLQGDDFYAYSLVSPSDQEGVAVFADALRKAEIWIANSGHEFISRHPPVAEALAGKTIMTMPMIEFHAFHPDMTYLVDRRNGLPLKPDYNSRIIFWAWREGVPADRVPALFTEEAMGRLGYFDEWQRSEGALRASFDACGLDFGAFFLPVKRLGAFMHTMNHPRVEALNSLAKVIARKLGAPPEVDVMPVRLPDFIDNEIWPIYPPIGRRLGLPHAYLWRTEGRNLGLEDYIRFAYDAYDRHALPREHADFHNRPGGPDPEGLAAILREQYDRSLA